MDTDLGFRTRLIQVGAWTLFPAVFIGMAVGYSRGTQAGYGAAVSIVLGLCAVVALEVFLSGVALLITEAGGWVTARLSHPNSVAYRFDHSGARALIAHGEIEKGVLAFEAAVATYHEDPVPYTELARIHRDHLGQSDAALRWFRKARDLGKLSVGETKVVMRETHVRYPDEHVLRISCQPKERMTAMKIGQHLVALCQEGKHLEAIDQLYAEDVVSVEATDRPEGEREARGIDAIRSKNQWWSENHEVHSASVRGPFPHSDDRCCVMFNYDPTNKPSGHRFQMEEVGLYTVTDGKISKEEFFYAM